MNLWAGRRLEELVEENRHHNLWQEGGVTTREDGPEGVLGGLHPWVVMSYTNGRRGLFTMFPT